MHAELHFQETVSLSRRFTFRIKKAEFIRTSRAKQELKATSTGYRTNFQRVEQFDRTCCSHGIEQSFSYVNPQPTNRWNFKIHHLPTPENLNGQDAPLCRLIY